VVLVSAVVFAPAMWFLAKAYGPVDAEDVFAFHLVTGIRATRLTDRLFAAYLSRARRYRTSWSVAGWVSGIALSVSLRSGREVGFGRPGQPLYTNLILMGFGGYLLGAIVAELHHLQRSPTQPRTASLTPRRLSDYTTRRQILGLRIVAALSVVAVVVGLVADRTAHNASVIVLAGGTRVVIPPVSPNSFAIPLLGIGLFTLLAWFVIERTQRAIVHRARPAMSDELARADDAIRVTSVETLALGGTALLALLTSYQLELINNGTQGESWTLWVAIPGFVLFWIAVALAFRTRRLVWPRRQIDVDGATVVAR
jgi:hypothetical protein